MDRGLDWSARLDLMEVGGEEVNVTGFNVLLGNLGHYLWVKLFILKAL